MGLKKNIWSAAWISGLCCFTNMSLAQDLNLYRVPDEIETTGDHANGLSNGGSAAVSGLASIRQNPAMLIMERNYKINAGYNWPSSGREFFNGGIVDGTAIKDVAAGVNYTSFTEDYNQDWAERKKANQEFDSPVQRRFAGGLAHSLGKVAIGVSAQYVQGFEKVEDILSSDETYKQVKGSTFGLGLAGLFTPALRFGLSAENLANGKIDDLAPTTYRAGLAYLMFDGQLSLHLDGVQRQRVRSELEDPDQNRDPERMAIASFSVKFYELFRLLAAYGKEVDGERQTVSGGIALVNDKFSLSYTQREPYYGISKAHQSVNLGMVVTM